MRSCKLGTITAIIAAIIAMMAFLIIYRDITSPSKPQGIFVCYEGVLYI